MHVRRKRKILLGEKINHIDTISTSRPIIITVQTKTSEFFTGSEVF